MLNLTASTVVEGAAAVDDGVAMAARKKAPTGCHSKKDWTKTAVFVYFDGSMGLIQTGDPSSRSPLALGSTPGGVCGCSRGGAGCGACGAAVPKKGENMP